MKNDFNTIITSLNLSKISALTFLHLLVCVQNRKEAALSFVSLRGLVARTIQLLFLGQHNLEIEYSISHTHSMFYSTDNDIITYPSNILNYTTEIHEVTHHLSNFCGALTRKCALFYFYFLLLKLKGTQGKLHTQFIRLDVAIPFIISMHITGSWMDTLNFRIHQYRCEQKISG